MELRLYSFVNFYLSSIQQGIQTGHAAVDLVRKYSHLRAEKGERGDQAKQVLDWADNHKTFYVLNGGDAAGIESASRLVEDASLPFAVFRESAEALDRTMTCVCVVLPEIIFNAKRTTAYDVDGAETLPNYVYRPEGPDVKWEEIVAKTMVFTPDHKLYNFLVYLKGCPLAR